MNNLLLDAMKRLVSSRLVAVAIDRLKSKLRRSAKAEYLLAVPETGTFSLKPIIDVCQQIQENLFRSVLIRGILVISVPSVSLSQGRDTRDT